jgi:hydrogenase-4 component E
VLGGLCGSGFVVMPLSTQLINMMAALLLLISFAMLSQRRILSLIYLFAWQGAVLAANSVIVAWSTGQSHLYYSALLTFALKVIVLPWILHRLAIRLNIRWDVETLINIPTTMLAGIALVIISFNLALPITQLAGTITRSTLGIAIAIVLLSFLMMITRRKAVPQVIGFLAMENGLFFAATSTTYGMPMVVELGVALDVLIGMLILGIFFFQVREAFDSLDLKHMEKLKEE